MILSNKAPWTLQSLALLLLFSLFFAVLTLHTASAVPLHQQHRRSALESDGNTDAGGDLSPAHSITFSGSRTEYPSHPGSVAYLPENVGPVTKRGDNEKEQKRGYAETQYIPRGTGSGGQYSKDQPYGR